ncbi:hypothetical protein [Devosia sp.]|uniref:hypothetical protein n=1 Tax=Devosia sp. TaxID=1871048 RepID=UPI003F71E74A
MTSLLRIITAVVLALLLASASVATSPHTGGQGISSSVETVAARAAHHDCSDCGLHESLTCAQLCVGSLQPLLPEPSAITMRVSEAPLSPLIALLPDGELPTPVLTPPIA